MSSEYSPETKQEAEQRRRAFTAVPAAFAFVFTEDDEHLLLHRRQNTNFLDGFLDVPGGHENHYDKENGSNIILETPIEAAQRELEEEAGLSYDVKELVLFAMHTAVQADVNYRYSAYCVRGLKGQAPRIGEPARCSEIGMFNVSSIMSGGVKNVSPIILRLIVAYEEFMRSGTVHEEKYILPPEELELQ